MRPDEREKRPPVVRVAAIAASLVVAAVLGGLVGARLGGGDAVEREGAWPPPLGGFSVDAQEVVVELRVLQRVDDPLDVWIRTGPLPEEGDPLLPTPFPIDQTDGGGSRWDFHFNRDLTIAGVELRLWQRYRAPELLYAEACVTPCASGVPFAETDPRGNVPVEELWPWQTFLWNPLGKIALPLDDGEHELNSARYRYADLTVAVPVGNPGLAADRAYLLALKDALTGTGELNWDAGTRTAEWDGVRLSGWPPRVTGLDLADRGLDGEIWGWLGDLTELTELRLDGNRLTGVVPSKLAQLTGLTVVGLAGNALEGCMPPPLRDAAFHDLALLGLPDCDPPTLLVERGWERGRGLPRIYVEDAQQFENIGGSYRWGRGGFTILVPDPETGREPNPFSFTVMDVPRDRGLTIRTQPEPHYDVERPFPSLYFEDAFGRSGGLVVQKPVARAGYLWLLLELSGREIGRSHYEEDGPAEFRILERIAASIWVNRVTAADGEWVWP